MSNWAKRKFLLQNSLDDLVKKSFLFFYLQFLFQFVSFRNREPFEIPLLEAIGVDAISPPQVNPRSDSVYDLRLSLPQNQQTVHII